jgi:hypothetical protein
VAVVVRILYAPQTEEISMRAEESGEDDDYIYLGRVEKRKRGREKEQ